MATQAKRPRPNKNGDGQPKQPTYNHTVSIAPAPPPKPQPAPPAPGSPPPGSTNPLTHPMHPEMQSALGTAAGGPQKVSAQAPMQGNANPSGNPLGNIVPTPSQDVRQVREQIAFKDMSPVEQSQTAMQQGLDPYAPLKMVQQGVVGALQAGPSTGPVPNELAGPYMPPGVEGFPDDFAHLSQLMKQGYAPGASSQEHEYGQNAHAMVRAQLDQAFKNAQNGVGQEQDRPYAQPGQPSGEPTNVGFAPGIPEQAGPQAPTGAGPTPQVGPQPALGSALGAGPSAAPGVGPQQGAAPPPALIAALLAHARGKNKQSNQNVQRSNTAGGPNTG